MFITTTMEEKMSDNIPSGESSEHFPSADVTVGDTCTSYVTAEINPDHFRASTSSSTFKEKGAIYARVELTHDHFRFAYDLVELVLEIRKELNPNVPRNLPDPLNYHFTKDHAKIIRNLLENDANYLLHKIHELSNSAYDFDNYLVCRDFFVQEWKNRAYTEKSFISACASIAFVAAHFIQMNYHCGALDNVVEFIAIWVRHILERGTIDQSCW